jgi:hypothetical protein
MKSPLKEIALGADAVKTARSEPIQQEQARPSMDFIRSLVLDVPVQEVKQPPVQESLNIERMLDARLNSEARKVEDPTDHVSFDVPTLIRVFELVREGIKSDVDLHDLVERLVSLRHKGVLTMADYDAIAGGNINGTRKEPGSIAVDQQHESIAALKKLAGL